MGGRASITGIAMDLRKPSTPPPTHWPFRAGLGAVLLTGALAGCRFEAMNMELIRQGHAAMVDCLQGERAITGGDELRCEQWDYVRENYLRPEQKQQP
jgi:hypothetical protein